MRLPLTEWHPVKQRWRRQQLLPASRRWLIALGPGLLQVLAACDAVHERLTIPRLR
jgi:hypothetical protein